MRIISDMDQNRNADLQKIPDAGLREFAQDDSATTRSVIVELAAGDAPIEFEPSSPDGSRGPRPRAVMPSDEQNLRTEMQRLEDALHKLVGQDLVRLNAAQAFVVSLTPAQLRSVASLAEAGVIRPNRSHRV